MSGTEMVDVSDWERDAVFEVWADCPVTWGSAAMARGSASWRMRFSTHRTFIEALAHRNTIADAKNPEIVHRVTFTHRAPVTVELFPEAAS